MNANTKKNLDNIREMRANYERYQPIMTPYEDQVTSREIKRFCEAVGSSIMAAVQWDWKLAISKCERAIQKTTEAKQSEINRWDSAKFNAELDTAKNLVGIVKESKPGPLGGGMNAGAKLNELYQEAFASGDIFKQRAMAEVVFNQDFGSFGPDARQVALALANQAKRDLEILRITPEMQAAEEKKQQAFADLQAERQSLIDTAAVLGEPNPEAPFAPGGFAKMLKMVEIIAGKIKIHAEDSPEVTGIFFKGESATKDASGQA